MRVFLLGLFLVVSVLVPAAPAMAQCECQCREGKSVPVCRATTDTPVACGTAACSARNEAAGNPAVSVPPVPPSTTPGGVTPSTTAGNRVGVASPQLPGDVRSTTPATSFDGPRFNRTQQLHRDR